MAPPMQMDQILSPTHELSAALKSRQAKADVAGSVFEANAHQGKAASAADASWSVKQWTPRGQDGVGNLTSGPSSARQLVGHGGPKQIPEEHEVTDSEVLLTPLTISPRSARGPLPMPNPTSSSWGGNDTSAEDVQSLREHLDRERQRSSMLEKRATEAEFIAVWLKEEIDRSQQNVPAGASQRSGDEDDSLGCTRVVSRGVDRIPEEDEMEQTRTVTRAKTGSIRRQGSLGPRSTSRQSVIQGLEELDADQIREEFQRLLNFAEDKENEALDFQEQNLDLREDLNREKQKVIDIMRAQQATHAKASGDEELTQWLQEEVAFLRAEAETLREKLSQSGQRERALQKQVRDLTQLQTSASLDSARGAQEQKQFQAEEMERLSNILGGQLMSVEQELMARAKELSALEPFFLQAHTLLADICGMCARFEVARSRPPPKLHEKGEDVSTCLSKILDAQRYIESVLKSRVGPPPVMFPGPSDTASELGDRGSIMLQGAQDLRDEAHAASPGGRLPSSPGDSRHGSLSPTYSASQRQRLGMSFGEREQEAEAFRHPRDRELQAEASEKWRVCNIDMQQ
mmetsp:Transcript_129908/g.277385  ORF Transcript_129908/g.277385 Transcript_129908/m.277385 type:complete len:573 (-) Transcript_129908:33-1751(-)